MTARKRLCRVCWERPLPHPWVEMCGECELQFHRYPCDEKGVAMWAARRARAFERRRAKKREDVALLADLERDEEFYQRERAYKKNAANWCATAAKERDEWKARALAAEAKLAEKDRS